MNIGKLEPDTRPAPRAQRAESVLERVETHRRRALQTLILQAEAIGRRLSTADPHDTKEGATRR